MRRTTGRPGEADWGFDGVSNVPAAPTGPMRLGVFLHGDELPEYGPAGYQDDAALEELRPGQLSKPIQVKDGVYIIYLRDKRAGSATSRWWGW